MCSRLVILPDYQGIGLGIKFLTIIAEKYKKMGFQFDIVTSAKNMIMGLSKNKKWRFAYYFVHREEQGSIITKGTTRLNNKTATFQLR
jgi:hypothetical protein